MVFNKDVEQLFLLYLFRTLLLLLLLTNVGSFYISILYIAMSDLIKTNTIFAEKWRISENT